eukprot:CAMPEP_0114118568 /NCGR_PEP_ID=MMETSP0043_2-20121206/5648_1 /TAXON_ID=464988 /ORGANISM="Hemiselmis andersenii, Strain CCMP644" /LENGTH=64 /DNA_ID=CAMNT_0001211059 /DNA_START=129 /DNA_END=324 /DNA_ORIENTATION=-
MRESTAPAAALLLLDRLHQLLRQQQGELPHPHDELRRRLEVRGCELGPVLASVVGGAAAASGRA